jgi:plasmid stabilization system protein ParE
MKLFVLIKSAERDLGQIKNFLLEKAGPTITRRVLKDISTALKLLGTKPEAGHVREDLTGRPLGLHGMRDVEEILM